MQADIPRTYDELAAEDRAELAALYHENSKLSPAVGRSFGERIAEFTSDPETLARLPRSAKSYPGRERIRLDGGFRGWGASIFRIMRRRRTRRDFSGRPLALRDLARLLYFAAAETGGIEIPGSGGVVMPLRAAPSAGALHSIEIYPVLFDVTGAAAGVYHYNVPEHSLELLRPGELRAEIGPHLLAPELVPGCAAALVLTGVFTRLAAKYGERGYRFLLLDAGHLAQNVVLVAEALGLAAVPLGGFHDEELDRALGIDGRSEASLYPILLASR